MEGELYVPEECFADPQRGREAGIPEEMEFRTAGEIALSMIHRLRRGLVRSYRVRCRLRPSAVAVARPEVRGTFLAEVYSDQTIYLSDPAPAVPARQSARARRPVAVADPTADGGGLGCRPAGVRGADCRCARGREGRSRRRLLEAARGCGMVLSSSGALLAFAGAPRGRWREAEVLPVQCQPEASLRRLADMQMARHFVERHSPRMPRGLSHGGLSARAGRRGHHMALVMVALMFLAKERLAHRETADLLSLQRPRRNHAPQTAAQDRNRCRLGRVHRVSPPTTTTCQEFRL